MPKDTESLGNNKAPACESRGFVRKIMKVCILTHLLFFVIPLRFERKTHALEGRCSIQLSYGTILNCGAKVRFFMKTTNFTPKIFIIYIKIIDLYMKSK